MPRYKELDTGITVKEALDKPALRVSLSHYEVVLLRWAVKRTAEEFPEEHPWESLLAKLTKERVH